MHDKRMVGYTVKMPSNSGNLYITLSFRREGLDNALTPKQLLITVGKAGGELQALVQAIYLMFNKSLERDVPIDVLVASLKGISSDRILSRHDIVVRSIPDAIAQGIEQILETFRGD
jgi:hypothetical protein